jgi:hypothetical protein
LRNPTYALRDETLLHDARRPTLDKAAILYYTHNGHNTHRERETKTATRIPKCVSGVCTYWERC